MVHALTSRLNKRLKISPQLLQNEETKDCQVDFDGFDNDKLTNTDTSKTIVNDQYKCKLTQSKGQLGGTFPKKKTTVYTPCGTDNLFKEIPTSVTASLGLTTFRGRGNRGANRRGFQRFPRRGNFKRGIGHGNFNQHDMARFLDDYFAYQMNDSSTTEQDVEDIESVHSYTTEDQNNCNIALPRSNKPGKSATSVVSPGAANGQGKAHGYTREEIENMDLEEEIEDYEDQDNSTEMPSSSGTTTQDKAK